MKNKPTTNSSDQLLSLIIEGMQDKKAEKITVIKLKEVGNAVADYFVICSGNSDTQTSAIADSVDSKVKKTTGEYAWQTEGKTNKEWILLDYADIVVHIFKKETREFYSLEELWGDAEIIEIEDDNN